ncbi:hypothetical protein PC123_g6485 [Phytophthora cactorum]|nr:hypothetical protein PC123_g6485 [Phytophthora cactorum]
MQHTETAVVTTTKPKDLNRHKDPVVAKRTAAHKLNLVVATDERHPRPSWITRTWCRRRRGRHGLRLVLGLIANRNVKIETKLRLMLREKLPRLQLRAKHGRCGRLCVLGAVRRATSESGGEPVNAKEKNRDMVLGDDTFIKGTNVYIFFVH